MHHRRRRAAVGLVLLALVSGTVWLVAQAVTAGSSPAGASAATATPALAASVEASGTPVGAPSGWRVQKVGAGRYVLEFAEPVQVSLASWEITATALLRPLTDRSWQVDFVDGHRAVDSAFSFTAVGPP